LGPTNQRAIQLTPRAIPKLPPHAIPHGVAATDIAIPKLPPRAPYGVEATDIVIQRRDHNGWVELYCVTCSAWCGESDRGEPGCHIASKKHQSWVAWYQAQKAIRALGPVPSHQPLVHGAGADHGAEAAHGTAAALEQGMEQPQQRMKQYVTQDQLVDMRKQMLLMHEQVTEMRQQMLLMQG
jgi:hypothetical protein